MPNQNNPMNSIAGLLPMIQQYAMQGPGQGYGGPTIAGFTPMQMAGWAQQMQGAQNYANAGQGMMGMYGNALQGGGNVNAMQVGPGQNFNFLDSQNPYMQDAVQGAMNQNNQNFMRNIMPAIGQGATGSGTTGGSRHGVAQGMAINDLNQTNSNMASNAYQNMYNNNMQNYLGQRQQNIGVMQGNQMANLQGQMANQDYMSQLFGQGAGMLQGYGQSQAAPGGQMGDIGGQQQAMNQSQLNAAQSAWEGGQNANLTHLQNVMGLFTGTGAGNYNSTSASGGK